MPRTNHETKVFFLQSEGTINTVIYFIRIVHRPTTHTVHVRLQHSVQSRGEKASKNVSNY